MYLFLQSELLFQWCSLAQGYTAYFLMTAFIVIYHLENKQIIIIIIIYVLLGNYNKSDVLMYIFKKKRLF